MSNLCIQKGRAFMTFDGNIMAHTFCGGITSIRHTVSHRRKGLMADVTCMQCLHAEITQDAADILAAGKEGK